MKSLFVFLVLATLSVSIRIFAIEIPSTRTQLGSTMCEGQKIEGQELRKFSKKLKSIFKVANVKMASPTISEEVKIQFGFELLKFPKVLLKFMAKNGGEFKLLDSSNVAADPTWLDQFKTVSKDNRDWEKVPGSGGFPYYQRLYKVSMPTRIAVQSLYNNHGSINLVLHEHAHSLDSTVALNAISSSEDWTSLMKSIGLKNVLLATCGSYCADHNDEAFAEAFAMMYSCENSHNYLKSKTPETVQFIESLVTDFKDVRL